MGFFSIFTHAFRKWLALIILVQRLHSIITYVRCITSLNWIEQISLIYTLDTSTRLFSLHLQMHNTLYNISCNNNKASDGDEKWEMLLYMFLNNVHISMIFNALRALIYQISLTQMCEHVLGLLQWTITMMQWLELLLHIYVEGCWKFSHHVTPLVMVNTLSKRCESQRSCAIWLIHRICFRWCGIIKNPHCSKTISTMQRSTSICDSKIKAA